MAEQEINLINTKIEEYNKYKKDIFLKAEKINTYTQQNISGSDPSHRIVKTIPFITRSLENSLLSYDEIPLLDYINNELEKVAKILIEPSIEPSFEAQYNALRILDDIYNYLERYIQIKKNFKDLTINSLSSVIQEVNTELTSFRRLRNIADNTKTENIYNNAVVMYRDLEGKYRSYFYWGLLTVLFLSVGLLTLKKDLVPYLFSTIEFWAVKASILLVGITLISYFLKQSAHYQRLADQNFQTQVELQAYPSFMESIPTEEAASVRKELALKYFGREVDGAAHKDMSNLISEQMKNTTEMVKATTEAIKNLKG